MKSETFAFVGAVLLASCAIMAPASQNVRDAAVTALDADRVSHATVCKACPAYLNAVRNGSLTADDAIVQRCEQAASTCGN